MKKIRTNTYEITVDEHGILRRRIFEKANVDLSAVLEVQTICKELAAGKKNLALIDARAFHTYTPEAMEHIKTNMDSTRIATAVLTESLGVRIMVDYMDKVMKVKSPIKIFAQEKKAIEWLLSFKEKKQSKTKPAFNQAGDKIKNKMRTKSHELYLDKYGIMHRKVIADSHIDIGSIQATDKISLAMNKGKKLLLLVNARTPHTLTPAAATYLKKNVPKTRIATAVLAGGANTKVLNTFMTPRKGTPPMRMFIKETEAVKWLLSFKKSKPTGKKTIPTSPKRKKSR